MLAPRRNEIMNANNPHNHARQVGLVLVGLMSATLATGPIRPASVQADGGSWSYTGSLNELRMNHTATLLSDGKVLVVGGSADGDSFATERFQPVQSAELYDPDTGKWNATGRLFEPRTRHTATRLKDGKVLIVGGLGGFDGTDHVGAELYDPDTRTWSSAGRLNEQRFGHTATLLENGKVLVVGGYYLTGFFDEIDSLGSAELYDPDTGVWSFTGNHNILRGYHSNTLLQNGKVLVLGSGGRLFDPGTGTWSSVGIRGGGDRHTATLLSDGKVLIVGFGGGESSSAWLYDPDTGVSSSTGHLNTARFGHTATLLPDGKVIVAGGLFHHASGIEPYLPNPELYDPETGTWSFTSNLNTPRDQHTATLLPDGKVLLVGGYNPSSVGVLPSAELGHNFAAVALPRPAITKASVEGKKLFITGENFHAGAVILINGEVQRTRNDDENPQTGLIGKNAGKKIKPGDRVQVRNPDGTISEEFTFAGS